MVQGGGSHASPGTTHRSSQILRYMDEQGPGRGHTGRIEQMYEPITRLQTIESDTGPGQEAVSPNRTIIFHLQSDGMVSRGPMALACC